MLDTTNPYTVYVNDNDTSAFQDNAVFDTGSAPQTMADDPASPLDRAEVIKADTPGLTARISTGTIHDAYEDYLMYQPPGSKSEWVPLRYQNWYWQSTYKRNADGSYSDTSTGPSPGEPDERDIEPLWGSMAALRSDAFDYHAD